MSEESKAPEFSPVQQPTKFTAVPQVDVEGQTAQIEYRAPIQAGAQNGGPGAAIQGVQGNIPGIIQYTAGVGDMANAAKTSCAGCKWFDVRAWRQFVAEATGPLSSAESRQTIQTMRSRIMMAGYGYEDNQGEVDIEQTLMAHGICRPLSDWVEGSVGRDPVFLPVVPWREATCPNTCHAGPHTLNVVTPAEPFGLFKPKDLEAKQIGANRYDNLLRAAQSVKLK
jgi:hypothetical protein